MPKKWFETDLDETGDDWKYDRLIYGDYYMWGNNVRGVTDVTDIEQAWTGLFSDAFDAFTREQFEAWLTFVRECVNDCDPTTEKPISPAMAMVLCALDNSQTIMTQEHIAKAIRTSGPKDSLISKRTISKIMPKLERRKWVIRPDGERSGYMLTAEGEQIVANLDSCV